MAETIVVELPQPGLRDELCETLRAHGLRTELIDADSGDTVGLRVRFADERERLVAHTALAIEDWLAAHELPLIVERANGGCLLRPPGD